MIEGGSPNALVRRGITKNSIPVGSELVIRGYGTRDGSNKAVGRDMKFADGRALFFGGTAAPGEAAPRHEANSQRAGAARQRPHKPTF